MGWDEVCSARKLEGFQQKKMKRKGPYEGETDFRK
jgi:hypothetical protein